MTISDNIKFRAIGLLTSFTEYCRDKGVSPLKAVAPAPSAADTQHSPPAPNILGVTDLPPSPDSLDASTSSSCAAGISLPGVMYTPGTGMDTSVDMDRVIDWLNHRFGGTDISETTMKCYRRWLASYFDAVGHSEAAVIRSWVAPHSIEARLRDDQKDALSLSVLGTTHTSSGKRVLPDTVLPGNDRYLSFVDADSVALLVEQLLSTSRSSGRPRYRSGPETALFFTVTMMTGLRPNEWPLARFLETHFDPDTKMTLGPVLEVESLKQANRRDDNPLRDHRYLVLDDWPESQLAQLRAFMDQINQPGYNFDSLYNRARMTLTRAWESARRDARAAYRAELAAIDNGSAATLSDTDGTDGVPALPAGATTTAVRYSRMLLVSDKRSVSLYTARHIFAEEIRRTGDLTRFELAALLGHSLITNQVYYGPLREELDREYEYALPRPWPGDADDIELWDYKVNPLRTAYTQPDMFDALSEQDADAGPSGSDFHLR